MERRNKRLVIAGVVGAGALAGSMTLVGAATALGGGSQSVAECRIAVADYRYHAEWMQDTINAAHESVGDGDVYLDFWLEEELVVNRNSLLAIDTQSCDGVAPSLALAIEDSVAGNELYRAYITRHGVGTPSDRWSDAVNDFSYVPDARMARQSFMDASGHLTAASRELAEAER